MALCVDTTVIWIRPAAALGLVLSPWVQRRRDSHGTGCPCSWPFAASQEKASFDEAVHSIDMDLTKLVSYFADAGEQKKKFSDARVHGARKKVTLGLAKATGFRKRTIFPIHTPVRPIRTMKR